MKVFAVAGNYAQYRKFLREKSLTEKDVRYIQSSDQLLGLYDFTLITIGDYYIKHKELIREAKARRAEVVESYLLPEKQKTLPSRE